METTFLQSAQFQAGGVRQVMETIGAKEGDYVRLYLNTAASGEWTGTVEVFPTNFEQ